MTKRIQASVMTLAAAILFSTGMFAQQTTEVTIKVKKDGKVVKDTTYQFDDEAEAKSAIKMMEILSGEDGKKTEIKELYGDSLVWVSEGDDNHGENTWSVDEKELKHIDEDVYVISEDDEVKVKIEKIMKEHEGDDVKVIVVKKIHEDGDHDHDKQGDHSEDIDIKVEKKVKKKSKKQ